MKKNLLLYLFAVLCTVTLFTACSDDDEPQTPTIPVDEEIAGKYKGGLDVSLVMEGGTSTPAGTVASQIITVTKAGEASVNLQITNFSFMGLDLGTINLNNCQLVETSAGVYGFTASTTMDVTGVLAADIAAEGTFSDGGLDLDLDIDNVKLAGNSVNYTVKVIYAGDKMTGNESSAAEITSFVFDREVALVDSLVLGEPVIDAASKTVTFVVADTAKAEHLAILVPTFEISKGATVTPASGVAQDFSNGKVVTYTVTAEDGTVAEWKVSVSGNMSVYSFEGWSSSGEPEGWATCNAAVSLIKAFGGMAGITYDGPMPIREDEGLEGKAALLQSIDTQGGTIMGTPVPKVTAGSMFLGTFNAFSAVTEGDAMKSTKFGIVYDKKPLKVKGYYKYTPGTDFYEGSTLNPDRADACALSAILYEVENEDETLDGNNVYSSDKIVAMAKMTDANTVTDWTEFELNLEYKKDYDPTKMYKFAVIFSASEDGAAYNAAVGSTLWIDEVTIENEGSIGLEGDETAEVVE